MLALAFALSAALGAIAGILITPTQFTAFNVGVPFAISGFIAAIVGGFNQVRGALVGGLLLGVIDNFAAAYLSSQYRMAIPLLILIAVILVRPQGLLGRVEERTV
jgi:branched-chain amino acid transport system permease protein